MIEWLRKPWLCRWCLSVAGLLLVYSGTVYAQSATPHDGPTWETLVPYAFGLVIAVIAAYVRGLVGRVDRVEALIEVKKADSNSQIMALKERLLTEHPTQSSLAATVRAELAPLELRLSFMEKELTKLDAIHARLDRLHVPSPRNYVDDGA